MFHFMQLIEANDIKLTASSVSACLCSFEPHTYEAGCMVLFLGPEIRQKYVVWKKKEVKEV